MKKRIIQITDLHIAPRGEYPYGHDSRQTMITTLDLLDRLLPADLLVLTGDLSYREPDEQIYRWIRRHIFSFDIPVTAISGNHDNSDMVCRFFTPTHQTINGELYYQIQDMHHCYYFLDTTSSSISDSQLAWLDSSLHSTRDSNLLPMIFMHHPPCLCGVPHMDRKYPFKRSEDLGAILHAYSGTIPIFCGHYHTEKTVHWGNCIVHITPSTCFEIDQFSDSFALDPTPPGLRVIDTAADYVGSSVIRV